LIENAGSRKRDTPSFSGAGLHAKRSAERALGVLRTRNRYHFETTEEFPPLLDLHFESITWMPHQLQIARSGSNWCQVGKIKIEQ